MVSTDFNTALGRLLTDCELLSLFLRDRPSALLMLGVEPVAQADWLAIDGDDLAVQAQILRYKRWHEVHEHLPRTITSIGSNAIEHFMSYVPRYWPTGYQRHWDDAYQFCCYLMKLNLPVCRDEINRLNFILSKKRVAIYFLHQSRDTHRPRHAIQILYRVHQKVRETRLYLAFFR